MKLITLHTEYSLERAYLLRSLLENEGIECFLMDEQLASLRLFGMHSQGGVRLQVKHQDLIRSQEVFRSLEIKDFDVR